MYGFIYRNSDPNVFSEIFSLIDTIQQKNEVVENVIDIKHLFPRWILDRNSNGNMVQFVQAYYDWLYNNSEYELTRTSFKSVGLKTLIDIDDIPVQYLKYYVKSYVPDFPDWYLGVTSDYGDNTPFVRNFVKGIRQNFYQKKSTEDAYQYFFESLYDVTNPVYFFYPKKYILRLNGGRFEDWPVADVIGGTGDYDPIYDPDGQPPWKPS